MDFRLEKILDQFELAPGVIFTPSSRIDNDKAPYLVIEDLQEGWRSVRLSFNEEELAGTYDIIHEPYIIETWNALEIPKDTEVKGYKRISEDLILDVIAVRNSWKKGEIPNVSRLTGRNIFTDPDRLLFHESELCASQSLQKYYDGEIESLPEVRLWERIGKQIEIIQGLTAYLFSKYLVLLWSDTQKEAPELIIRDAVSELFATSHWEEPDAKKYLFWSIPIPDRVTSVILTIEDSDFLIEALPENQNEQQSLSLQLYQAYKSAESDSGTLKSDDLNIYGFGVLEHQAMKKGKELYKPEDKIGFAVLLGMCCEGLHDILRLSLFQSVEEEIQQNSNLSGHPILERLKTWESGGFSYQPRWFYDFVFTYWYKELEKYKGIVNPSFMVTEDELEESVIAMLETWQSAVFVPVLSKFSEILRKAGMAFIHGIEKAAVESGVVRYVEPVPLETPMKDNAGIHLEYNMLVVTENFHDKQGTRFDFLPWNTKNERYHRVAYFRKRPEYKDFHYLAMFIDNAGKECARKEGRLKPREGAELQVPEGTFSVIIIAGKEDSLKKIKNQEKLESAGDRIFTIVFGPDILNFCSDNYDEIRKVLGPPDDPDDSELYRITSDMTLSDDPVVRHIRELKAQNNASVAARRQRQRLMAKGILDSDGNLIDKGLPDDMKKGSPCDF